MNNSLKQFKDRKGRTFLLHFSFFRKSNKDSTIIMLSDDLSLSDAVKNSALEFAACDYAVVIPDIKGYLLSNYNIDQIYCKTPEKPSIDNQNLNQCPPIQLMEEIIEYVKTIQRPVGKIGIIGFFDGATLAYLTASRLKPDFAVAYFGGNITSYLTEGKNIKCPMMIHAFEPKKTVTGISNNKLEAALIGKENISIYNYIRKQNIDQSHLNSLLSSETLNKAHERTFKLLENLNSEGK